MVWNRFDQCYNHFKLEWRPDRIEIFYNGNSVRKVTDNKILSWYSNIQMRVIFNNGLEKLEDYTNDSVMLVKNFKYTPYQNENMKGDEPNDFYQVTSIPEKQIDDLLMT